MIDSLSSELQDVAWCRWVASFVSFPHTLVAKIERVLKPGGVVIFHEYLDYATWRMAPRRRPAVEEFVQQVMTNWRTSGGEPDVAPSLLEHLNNLGFKIEHVVPIIFCVRPKDYIWQWPAAFLEIGLKRLFELHRVDATWVESV